MQTLTKSSSNHKSTRVLFLLQLLNNNNPTITTTTTTTTNSIKQQQHINSYSTNLSKLAVSYKQWFNTHKNPQFDQIFTALSQNDAVEDITLNLRLSERTVLDILHYGSKTKGDVLSCLKFFDYAGRQQPGTFRHTRATFNAMFKILSKSKPMSLMLDFLHSFAKVNHNVRFYDTLVMGYAVAGKTEVALELFGKLRFKGVDLNGFAYHVLLNALVEDTCYNAADVIVKHISRRGLENDVTHAILTKSFCKQGRVDEAEAFLLKLVREGLMVNGHALSYVVDALCTSKRFERAADLMEVFKQSNVESMELAYGVWVRNLVHFNKLDSALDFLKTKKLEEGYIPGVFRYNALVCRLLKEKRLDEVFDLLMEMKEDEISPDKLTMNATLSLFCKAGMVNSALELYSLSSEFGLSVNLMAYNYLINTLCGDGSTDEAYRVLRNSIEQRRFPGKKTFDILADALCRDRKFDKMKDLFVVALEQNFTLNDNSYDKIICTLCRVGKVEDAYLMHGELTKYNKAVSEKTYLCLIDSFIQLDRGDIAARLLIEMQEKGHHPSPFLFRDVIRCICKMENPEKQFVTLFILLLPRYGSDIKFYKFFIVGAGHANKPELARQVYETMRSNVDEPIPSIDIVMLQSYLKNNRISDAKKFFFLLKSNRKIGTKLYNPMVVGLCKAGQIEYALEVLEEMRGKGLTPSNDCYENLIQSLCSSGQYKTAIELVDNLVTDRGHITPFIGNVFLLHSLKSKELYKAWNNFGKSSQISKLGQLVRLFSIWFRDNRFPSIDDLEKEIQQCFYLNIYTYNLLLRKLSINDIDDACQLFTRICRKGHEPNRWTYEILVQGLDKHGRTGQAKKYRDEM
ncbi:hypothetical protein ACFE04_030625 [Oxalis oulophora]